MEQILIHVEMEYEAVMLKNHLEECGFPAYFKPTPGVRGRLALPGALGINEHGYDIYVRPEHAKNAAETIQSLGYGENLAEETPPDDDHGQPLTQDVEAEFVSSPPQEPAAPPPLSPGNKLLVLLLLLVVIGVVVAVTDYIMKLIFGRL